MSNVLTFTERLFQNESPQTILDNLNSLCDKVEDDFGFDRKLSVEEMSDLKDTISTVSIEINDISDEMKEVTKSFRTDLKSKGKVLKSALKTVKKGSEWTKEKVYIFKDHEQNLVHIYDCEGVRIKVRPMLPEERQLHISMQKAS